MSSAGIGKQTVRDTADDMPDQCGDKRKLHIQHLCFIVIGNS